MLLALRMALFGNQATDSQELRSSRSRIPFRGPIFRRAGGNIGQPPWDPSVPEPDYWIVETSSFQVPDLKSAPRVVAVTSLSPDHLDWHGTVERYYADKLSLCTKPGVELALVEGTDPLLQQHRDSLGSHLRSGSSASTAE